MVRPSDDYIYYRQFPLGWLYFSVEHINGLLETLGKEMPGIRLEDLAPIMVTIWDFAGRDTYADPDDGTTLAAALAELDTETFKWMRDTYARLQSGQTTYSDYLKAPNRPLPLPSLDSIHNRITVTAETAGFVEGGTFDPNQSNVVPKSGTELPTLQPLTKYA